ncbi:MAG: hypothetical protein ACRENQ_12245 [Gemmatimonadaceae bacterium]
MRTLICAAAMMIGVVACTAPARAPESRADVAPPPAEPALVRVVARDFEFDSAHTAPAGLLAVRLVNEGHAIHMLGVSRLDSNKTAADLFRAIRANQSPRWFTELGGPGAVSPGDSTTSYLVLEPGRYTMICWWADSTGKAHIMDGMLSTLTVTGQNAGAPHEPAPDVYIRETDYHIAMPTTLHAGRHVFRVDNDGPQDHDVAIVRVLPGHTEAQAEQWIAAPNPRMSEAPVEALGGIVGQTRWAHTEFTADLPAGDYLVVCLIPDAKDQKPHFMHGMLVHLHVS